MTECLASVLAARDDPYVKGVVCRICSADETHISYPIRIPECDTSITVRFETEQKPRGGDAHRRFLEHTAGPATRVVSGDIAVVALDGVLGPHALASDTTETWGIMPVSYAEYYSKPVVRRSLTKRVWGDPTRRIPDQRPSPYKQNG